MSDALEKVARAIWEAQDEPRYSKFDYSTYPGDKPPHVIVDNVEKRVVYRSEREADASLKFFLLCRAEVAQAAIAAYEAERGALTERVRELEKTLLDFLHPDPALEQILWGDLDDSEPATISITMGMRRRARAVLNAK